MTENTSQISKKLDIIIRLLSIIALEKMKQKKKIKLLTSLGLCPKEIAEIIGTSPNTVRVALCEIRKGIKHDKSKTNE